MAKALSQKVYSTLLFSPWNWNHTVQRIVDQQFSLLVVCGTVDHGLKKFFIGDYFHVRQRFGRSTRCMSENTAYVIYGGRNDIYVLLR